MQGEYCPVDVGDIVNVELPFSEVVMSFRLAGKVRPVKVLKDGVAQIYDEDMNPFSFPILYGEAGIYVDGFGKAYTYKVGDDD